MTSNKNKENNKKNEDKSHGGTSNAPGGGGTSNAGNKSPANSLFSDGELLSPINQDVKPHINQPVDDSSGEFDTFEQLARLMNSLSEQGQRNIMTRYAEHAGFTLSKNILPTTTRQTSYPEAYKENVTHQDQEDMSPGMFDGRETPMNTGFSPNYENFSRRAETSYAPPTSPNMARYTVPPPNNATDQQPAFNTTKLSVQAGTPSSQQAHPKPIHAPNPINPRHDHTLSSNTTAFTAHTSSNINHQQASGRIGSSHVGAGALGSTYTPQPNTQGVASLPGPPPPPAWAPNATVPMKFQIGLTLRSTPRPVGHASYESDRVVIPHDKRGNTDKDRTKICRGNIAKLLSSADDSYDIASDATQWQATLTEIWNHVVQYDYTHITNIPLSFNPNDPTSFNDTSTFANAVLNHDQLTNKHYFGWQHLLCRFRWDEELLSDAWFAEKLWKSLDTDLRAKVRSDFNELPDLQKGSISLLRLIINRMVQSSQEARRAMEEFIRNFDIQKFSGKDVTKASLRIKAIAQSLGTNRLPSDIVHRILEGFARSSTPFFSLYCQHQKSMISSSLVKSALRQETLYKTLRTVLSNLEVQYNELLSGHRWIGLGNSMLPKSSFFTNPDSDSDDNTTDERMNTTTMWRLQHTPVVKSFHLKLG